MESGGRLYVLNAIKPKGPLLADQCGVWFMLAGALPATSGMYQRGFTVHIPSSMVVKIHHALACGPAMIEMTTSSVTPLKRYKDLTRNCMRSLLCIAACYVLSCFGLDTAAPSFSAMA